MKKLLIILTALLCFTSVSAQELNCRVQVQTPGISNVDRKVFESLRSSITEFMNNRRWTKDKYQLEERIDCTFLFTINSVQSLTRFSGTLQVQSNRLVYNSDYSSPMLNILDENIQFEYLDNTQIEFTVGQFRDDLTSILAYYAYLILGMDYDSFEFNGGTEYYNICQQIVSSAQNAGSAGWKAFESDRNRYWMVENVLHQTFKPLRKCFYFYHLHGLDKMYENPNQARTKIKQTLDDLKKVHQVKPISYNVTVFFQAKADELLNIYSEAPKQEKTAVYQTLQVLNPANLSKWEVLK